MNTKIPGNLLTFTFRSKANDKPATISPAIRIALLADICKY